MRSNDERDAMDADVVEFCKTAANCRFSISPHIPGKAEARAEVAQRHVLECRPQRRRSVVHNVPQSRLFAVLLTRYGDEFVTQTEVERQVGQDAEIIVGVKTDRVEMVSPVAQRTGPLCRIL